MAILNSDLLHDTVHHPIKFQANSWNPSRVRAVTSSLRPGPKTYHGKSSVEHTKNGRARPFWIVICSMILCITPPNFSLVPEIFKELERERCSGQTDRRRDERNDRQQYPSTPMAAEGNKNTTTKFISPLIRIRKWLINLQLNCKHLQINSQDLNQN